MKKTLTISAILLLAAFIAATSASAQGRRRHPGNMPESDDMAEHIVGKLWATGDPEKRFYRSIKMILSNREQLKLSGDQITELETLLDEAKKTLVDMDKEIETLDVEINTISWQEYDLDMVNGLVSQKYNLMQQKETFILSVHDRMNRVLTPEQRKIVRDMTGEGREEEQGRRRERDK